MTYTFTYDLSSVILVCTDTTSVLPVRKIVDGYKVEVPDGGMTMENGYCVLTQPPLQELEPVPVPEPGGLALLVGIVVVAMLGRKR